MGRRIISEKLLYSFEARMEQDERSRATINKYLHDIRCFMCFANGEAVCKSITLSYKSFLQKEYAVTSANSMIAAMNTFLRFAGWEDCCVKPFTVQRKIYCSEKMLLTKQEYIRLVETALRNGNERLALILQTICGTGIRVSELSFITVEAVSRGEAVVSCKNKTRTVFIVRELQKKLIHYIRKEGLVTGSVFVTRAHKAVSRCNIWREMKALCQDANVAPEKVFPHNLRHLFARIFYQVHNDLAQLADILGHFSINTTRIYIMSSGSEHRRKIERMRLII